jgi:N-acetyl-1-D-myo-inositol-2-amino-2-deoxy-alpha-D-glucopyranoside deacetylase
MGDNRTILFVGAHPDDETFGLGGTLAQYAKLGVKVYYACATRGEAGIADEQSMKGFTTIGDMRWAELQCAAKILGLTDVIHLGYRDSGMMGSEDNKNPNSLFATPVEEVANNIVKVIEEIKPQIVITFDPIGGYRHPDHIAIHNATVKAFSMARDRNKTSGSILQPQKLYFSIFPRGLMKFAVKLLPLIGQNPRKLGRNKDIDIASIMNVNFPVHSVIRLSNQAVETRDRASACYVSQQGGGPRRGLMGFLARIPRQRDYYMRGFPVGDKRHREHDFFEGVNSII